MSRHYRPRFFKHLKALRGALSSNILINQTHFVLSDLQTELLCLGLNFIPCPSVSPSDFSAAFDSAFARWVRAIDVSLHFELAGEATVTAADGGVSAVAPAAAAAADHASNGWLHSVIPSAWEPPSGSWVAAPEVVDAAARLKHSLTPSDSPLAREVTAAITQLGREHSIQILKADKGRSVVLWKTEDYDREALRQLDNSDAYEKLDRASFRARMMVLLNEVHAHAGSLFESGCITRREFDALTALYLEDESCGSAFYLLPKIHKPANAAGSYSGRPIVATFSNPIHLLDKYLANLTAHLLHLIPGSLIDTPDLLAALARLPQPLPPGASIVTADIDSMYPNIPWSEGVDASTYVYGRFLPELRRHAAERNLPAPPSANVFSILIAFVLRSSFIHFKNKYFYHQRKGTAMGMCISVFFANAYMYVVSRHLIDNPPSGLLLFLRYIDDILAIFLNATEDSVARVFLSITNDHMKYTRDLLRFWQHFLDVIVRINQTTFLIQTVPYWKDTASGSYLHPSSCHPSHTIEALPYSQFLRLQRISSTPEIAREASERLAAELVRSGYPRSLVNSAFSRASTATCRNLPESIRQRLGFLGDIDADPVVVTDDPGHAVRSLDHNNHNRTRIAANFKFVFPFHLTCDRTTTSAALANLHSAVLNHFTRRSPRGAALLSRRLSSLVFSNYRCLGSFFTSHIKQGVRSPNNAGIVDDVVGGGPPLPL